MFEEGLGFDGSSIRGWQAINESDMLVIPQAETAFMDPFSKEPTIIFLCNIKDPLTREDYSRDPRNIARKAVNYMKASGIAETPYFGPELEFFVFDDIRYDHDAELAATTTSTATKAPGTPAAMKSPISATRSATRKATSRCRPPINCRTCAPK